MPSHPSLPSPMTDGIEERFSLKNTFTHYKEYLLEKARKFMNNAKTSAAKQGINFEEKKL